MGDWFRSVTVLGPAFVGVVVVVVVTIGLADVIVPHGPAIRRPAGGNGFGAATPPPTSTPVETE
jgi:hypothetical protein